MKRTMITMAAVAASALALAACGSAESVGGNTSTGSSENGSTTLVVGSQDYYSNEIIAEAYAQALEGAGFAVDRQMRIGQREVYMPELEARSTSSPSTRATCCSTWMLTRPRDPRTRCIQLCRPRSPRACAPSSRHLRPTRILTW